MRAWAKWWSMCLQRGRPPAEAAAGVRVGPEKAPKLSAIGGGGAAAKGEAAGQCNASDGEQCSAVSAKVCHGSAVERRWCSWGLTWLEGPRES